MLVHIVSLICLGITAVAADGAQFVGYGGGIKGLPLFYSDGMRPNRECMRIVADQPAGTAYLGLSPPPNAAIATNVTRKQNKSPAISLTVSR